MKTSLLHSSLPPMANKRLAMKILLRLPVQPQRPFRINNRNREIIEDLMDGLCPPEMAAELLPPKALRLYRRMVACQRKRRLVPTLLLLATMAVLLAKVTMG